MSFSRKAYRTPWPRARAVIIIIIIIAVRDAEGPDSSAQLEGRASHKGQPCQAGAQAEEGQFYPQRFAQLELSFSKSAAVIVQ
jgi:hypothetical protein